MAVVEGFGVFALGIAGAGQKFTIATMFDDHGAVALLTGLVRRHVSYRFHGLNAAFLVAFVIAGVIAFRIGAAGDKGAILADLDMQPTVALRAVQFRGKADPLDAEHAIGRFVQLGFERCIELLQHGQGFYFVLFDPVQVVFHPGREFNIEDIREIHHDQIIDDKPQLAGAKVTFDPVHVALITNGGEN